MESAPSIVGSAASVEALRAQIRHLAAFDSVRNPHVPTVLLQGETGTGKGLVARVMHESGPRARGPFVDVNCAAIPETMLESELFGFEAGAFTDARRSKPGLFEAASGGSLFLDEIDALSVPLQSKLLKAIEEKSIRRLGAVRDQRVDVKLLAATQRDLPTLVAGGRFRADLYHRLAVVILTIPPLRERGEDVVVLAEHFLATYARAHGHTPKALGAGARRWMLAQAWPGNVRELSHLMERVTLLCPETDVSDARLAELAVTVTIPAAAAPPPARPAVADATGAGAGDEAARIAEALARSGGNVVVAARLLGIGRNALRYRMRRLAIARPRLDDPAPAGAGLDAAGRGRAAAARPRPASAPPSASPPPSWERKHVTVLAIELTFSEAGPAEAAAYEPWTVARRWRDAVVETVRGFGGDFLPHGPARLTAVFGAPRALEQMPERAAQAALAIRRLRADERRPPAEIRMALHLGSVEIDVQAADALARLLPVGDALTLPERLLGHAGPGEILASAPLARRIETVCDLTPRALRMGGGAHELEAYVIVAPHPRPPAVAEATAGLESRFVGREPELQLLRDAFARAAEGRGQVVFVVGDAGIGKSRLLAELRAGLDEDRHVWIEGHCASYGATTAFLSVVDGVRRYFGIEDRDDERGAGDKIRRGVAALGTDLLWTVPFVRQVLSLPGDDGAIAALDSASRRSETFRALKAIVLRAAEQRPVVLVVEDLHWIDPASEEFLGFLAEAVPTTRALLVCSHRPGYQHPFGDRTYHVRIALRPLSDPETAAMTGSLLGDAEVPAALRELIGRKAEGNPFFVEEVTKSLLEDGALRLEEGRVVLARAATDIAVPDTIQDVLSARLDRLADEARGAIQIASVIGREFALRLLARLVESGDRLHLLVDELRALELIYEKSMHPELAYMFKHALTHDVAYGSVLPARRQALHRTIGRAIEELYADRLVEHYETLAHHFTLGEDWPRALAYHERAAAKAAASYANRAVVTHCRAALAIAAGLGAEAPPDLAPRRASLEEQAGLACFQLSEFGAAGAAFERAAAASADPEDRAIHLTNAGLGYFWAHDYPAAVRTMDEALAIARAHRRPAAEALALATRAFYVIVHDADLDAFGRACAEAQRLCAQRRPEGADGAHRHDETVAAFVAYQEMMGAEWTGDYRRAIALGERVIAEARRLRLAHLVILPMWFLGKAACCLGDYGRALAQLEEAYQFCDRIGDRAWKSRLLNTLGWCLAEIGSHERARAFNERAAHLAGEIGDPEIIANAQINLALNALACGDHEAAGVRVEPLEAELARPGDPWMRWRYALHVADVRARLELARGAPDAALAFAERQRAGARRHRVPKVEARALVLQARAWLALERPAAAAPLLDEALAVATRLESPCLAWQALALMAEQARRAGQGATAAEHAARARALVAGAAASLADAELRGRLLASASGA